MEITITGPRSVGKTTISKLVARKLQLKYYSSDEIGEEHLRKYGGLDKAIKSGTIGEFIKNSAYSLIRDIYKKDNFVFDLSGGAVSSRKFAEASRKVRRTARESSIIIGLLPSNKINESTKFLFEREKKRKHFRETDKKELLAETKKDYKKFPKLFKDFCDFIIYVKGKSPEEIADEIIISIKEHPVRRDGWQCWVRIYEDYVIKTLKTENEIKESIRRHLGKKAKLIVVDKRAKKMLKDIKESKQIIKESNIPRELLAYPKFLKSGNIKQKRVIVIDGYLEDLISKGKKDKSKKVVDKCIDFIIELWKYGIHEKTFKFYSNFGYLKGKIVLIDLFELTNKKGKVEKQIQKKGWKHLEKIAPHFPEESLPYFLDQIDKRINLKNLNKYWRLNLR